MFNNKNWDKSTIRRIFIFYFAGFNNEKQICRTEREF